MTLSKTSIIRLNCDTQLYIIFLFAKCHIFTNMLRIVVLIAVILITIMSVVMQSFIMMFTVMLSVVLTDIMLPMLSANILIVVRHFVE